MLAEVVIHLGQEWRDLLMVIIGMLSGGGIGFMYGMEYMKWKARKK
jgi:uncharacterized membrane protein YsdA (DUF1294 family)